MRSGSPPLIGITADLSEESNHGGKTYCEPTVFLPRRYLTAIEHAGAIPLVLPVNQASSARRLLNDVFDGLLISGGNFDIHPRLYGEKPIKELGIIKPTRTEFELEIAAVALKRDIPVIGICGGAQAINVVLGGTLYQDIMAQLPSAGEHQKSAERTEGGHRVLVQTGTRLHEIVRRQTLNVNTTHHQAIKKLGSGLVINAVAEDGVIEGIESTQHRFVLGLQWHPEVLAPRQSLQRRIFSSFVAICKKHRSIRASA
jgi:putative glutamine amidotransferase